VDKYGDFYLLPADAEDWNLAGDRNILQHDLLGNLLKISAKNIFVILDSARSGALFVTRAWAELGQKTNLAILTAAAEDQYAIDSPEDRQGALTWAVLRALEGNAEKRENRYIGVNELLDYVREEVPHKSRDVIRKALPEAATAGEAGDIPDYLLQQPAGMRPEENFDLFDLKWRPAKVTLSALRAGDLRVKGDGQEQTLRLEAGKPVTLSLKEGRYEFTMKYQANIAPEILNAEVYNETESRFAFTGR
jgi:hypothetical protein